MNHNIAPVLVAAPSVVGQKSAELNQLKEREIVLQREIEAAREMELKDLPSRLGYADSAAFLRSFVAFHNLRDVPTVNRTKTRQKVANTRQNSVRKPRRAVTPELYAAIMSDIKSNRSKAYILKRHDISGPTYQNLKRDAGMTRPYNKK